MLTNLDNTMSSEIIDNEMSKMHIRFGPRCICVMYSL